MSQNDSTDDVIESRVGNKIAAGWGLMECNKTPRVSWPAHFYSTRTKRISPHAYSPDWASSVPSLIAKLASEIAEKKKMELRFTTFGIVAKDLKARVERLELSKTRIVPINTFVPEPYVLLRPILVSVQAIEDEFEAGWFDANIHTTGENEEEAVSNLKSLILDYFEIFTNEPPEKLGKEPARQLAILNHFIQKRL